MSTINSWHLYPELIVCTTTNLVLRIMEMGFCKWAKWKVNCSVLQPAIARWRRGVIAAAAASPAVPISTMEFSHPLSAALHQIFYASQLQSLLGASGCLLSCCYLLQMFKVSLFIIYTATVLDFVEVEHYIHNQAHNGYSHRLRIPSKCINQIL